MSVHRCFRGFLPACLGLVVSLWVSSAALADQGEHTPEIQAHTDNSVSVDAWINQAIRPVSQTASRIVFYAVEWRDAEGVEQRAPVIIFWLLGSGILLTFILRGVNIWGLAHALRTVRGAHDNPRAPGQITHFQALTAALSGTVGLGNIAGVAAAISLGGPGALLWMIAAAMAGMATKFAECALGVKYRHIDSTGRASGGPMHYLSRGFAERGWPRAGKGLAVIFAVCCIGGALGAGNMFQANQAYEQFVHITGGAESFLHGYGWAFGLVMAVCAGLVIIGGIRGIARVTEKIVPFMGLLYLFAGLVVIAFNIDQLPAAISTIVSEAFTPEAGRGGLIGVMVWGIQRAVFSNEAGIGSAPIAYAAVKTQNPLSPGFVSLLEPLIDTVIICSITALVIVISGAYQDTTGLRGIALTSTAFATVIDWFPYLLAVAILLFAFSTVITWSYYGLKCWTFLFGQTRLCETLFKLMFLCFTVLGASAQLSEVVAFSDAVLFAMAVPNLIGVFFLSGGLRRDLEAYRGIGPRVT